jgi:hypothetical protein
MNEIIFLVHEPPEGGYAAEALGQGIFTVADSLEEMNEMVRDAVICHFDDRIAPRSFGSTDRESISADE